MATFDSSRVSLGCEVYGTWMEAAYHLRSWLQPTVIITEGSTAPLNAHWPGGHWLDQSTSPRQTWGSKVPQVSKQFMQSPGPQTALQAIPQRGSELMKLDGCVGFALKTHVQVIKEMQGINKKFVRTHIKKQFGLLLRLLQFNVM